MRNFTSPYSFFNIIHLRKNFVNKKLDKVINKCYNSRAKQAEALPLLTGRRTSGSVNTKKQSFFCCGSFLPQFLISGVFSIAIKELMINEEITAKSVRLIGSDGEQLGIMDTDKAQSLADEAELDLVLMSPNADPPVCKIMDYGKYRFELLKKEKENRKNQRIVDTKEIKMTPSIDTHDFETKMNHGKKFLTAGDKLKVTIRFRGREINHSSLGVQLLDRVAEALADCGNVEKKPKLEGRTLFMIVAPIEKK